MSSSCPWGMELVLVFFFLVRIPTNDHNPYWVIIIPIEWSKSLLKLFSSKCVNHNPYWKIKIPTAKRAKKLHEQKKTFLSPTSPKNDGIPFFSSVYHFWKGFQPIFKFGTLLAVFIVWNSHFGYPPGWGLSNDLFQKKSFWSCFIPPNYNINHLGPYEN